MNKLIDQKNKKTSVKWRFGRNNKKFFQYGIKQKSRSKQRLNHGDKKETIVFRKSGNRYHHFHRLHR